MFLNDFGFVFTWWVILFFLGVIFLPFNHLIFSEFRDDGYIFSKFVGIAIISYLIFVLGLFKILDFSFLSLLFLVSLFLFLNLYLLKKKFSFKKIFFRKIRIKLLEEFLFLICFIGGTFVRGTQPDIHGLEKFMDFGFINSILRSNFFPPKDMWFTPFTINYYYFGHLVTAVLIRISNIPSGVGFNLMLATVFAFCFSAAFSIGINLVPEIKKRKLYLFTGLLSAFLVTLAGNLQTIYAFFKPYQGDTAPPFWQLPFLPLSFPNSYWYPTASRFIYHTIHEFPIYSWTVSDLHGHVLDIPFVLLTIALFFSIFQKKKEIPFFYIPLIGFFLSIMYMTNAWDGAIYLLLAFCLYFLLNFKKIKIKGKELFSFNFKSFAIQLIGTVTSFFLFSLPFNLNFKPFVSGIGLLCAPSFLVKIGKIGPFLFEENHCQFSPIWQLIILYGFFYFLAISFIFIFKKKGVPEKNDLFVFILIFFSTILIIIPEIIYVKDIYPAHFRANTMFKLVYQAFILLSISSGYIIIKIFGEIKFHFRKESFAKKIIYFFWLVFFFFTFFAISIYPYFSISSYYNGLKTYYGLDGTSYLKTLYPTDYNAITWLNKNIKGQPVILEAQGDSYTDYARVSANTGLPTVLGWTVHEWLWRGTYDIPAPRINDVKTLYETQDLEKARQLINRYRISLVFVGDLERQKYLSLDQKKFDKLGKIIFSSGNTKIYKITAADNFQP